MTLLVRTDPAHRRLQGPVHAAGRKAARHRGRSVPRAGHERHRNPRARLSRHEGIRDRASRISDVPVGQSARRRRGAGLQAADGDVRERPHPDRRAGAGRGAERAGAGGRAMRGTARSSARPIIGFPRVGGEDRLDGDGDDDGAAADLFRRAPEGRAASAATSRPAWRSCWPRGSPGRTPTAPLQIHGGNGYAVEYPISRVLCDARILSIFEGAAEIQAQVIARGIARPAELTHLDHRRVAVRRIGRADDVIGQALDPAGNQMGDQRSIDISTMPGRKRRPLRLLSQNLYCMNLVTNRRVGCCCVLCRACSCASVPQSQ